MIGQAARACSARAIPVGVARGRWMRGSGMP